MVPQKSVRLLPLSDVDLSDENSPGTFVIGAELSWAGLSTCLKSPLKMVPHAFYTSLEHSEKAYGLTVDS